MILGHLYLTLKNNEGLYLPLDEVCRRVALPIAKEKSEYSFDNVKLNCEMFEYVSFEEYNEEEFNLAYSLLMPLCDSVENLKPYKLDIEKLFKSDPRFKQIEVA